MHLESKFISDALWPTLSAQERALMRSQCGPLSSVAFTAFPTSRLTRFDSQPFWVLLLRRLHLPLPCLLVLGGVAVLSTLLATTGLHVQLLGFLGGGVSRSRVQLRGSAERQEPGCAPT